MRYAAQPTNRSRNRGILPPLGFALPGAFFSSLAYLPKDEGLGTDPGDAHRFTGFRRAFSVAAEATLYTVTNVVPLAPTAGRFVASTVLATQHVGTPQF
jgi:hypothetical protein